MRAAEFKGLNVAMGNAAQAGKSETPAASLAAGLPEALDWRTLIEHVFKERHQATVLVTPNEVEETPTVGCQPLKIIECISGSGSTPFDAANVFDGRVGMVSQKGKKAGPNQDSAFFMEFIDGDGSRIWLSTVMDGHGPLGHEMSRLAIQWLPLLVLREPTMAVEAGLIIPQNPQAVFDGISAAFAKAGSIMMKASGGSFERKMSGTTCSFCLCGRGVLHTAWIGDSRAVLGRIQQDSQSSLLPKVETLDLTRDHKPDDVVEKRRIQAHGGVISEKRVWLRDYPHCGLNLSRGFGDSLAHDVGVSHVPDVAATFLSEDPGQFALLASDGVWEFISSEEGGQSVGDRLQEGKMASWKNSAQEAASRLVRHATDCWKRECNELDDITAIVIQI